MKRAFRISWLPAAGLLLISAPERSSAGDFRLVENSTPRATIVVAEQASENARIAANEFQSCIEKISGARLPVISDNETPRGSLVLIGSSKLTERIPGLKIPSGKTKNLL